MILELDTSTKIEENLLSLIFQVFTDFDLLTFFLLISFFLSLLWTNQLLKDSLEYVHDFVAPGKMLSGRGTALVHLNDMIFRVMKGFLLFCVHYVCAGVFICLLFGSLTFIILYLDSCDNINSFVCYLSFILEMCIMF